jgi:hypothetical protein
MECDFDLRPSFVIRASAFVIPFSNPQSLITNPKPLHKRYSRHFAQIRGFEKRGTHGDANGKVQISKNDDQKIVPPWPPCLRVEPFQFKEVER